MNRRETVGLDPNTVIPALRGIKTGEQVIYHIGHLSNDRGGSYNNVGQNAKLAMDLSDQGRVKLFQRRLGPPIRGDGTVDWKFGVGPGFEYIAVGV